MEVSEIIQAQKAYFQSGKTLDVSVRMAALKRLRSAIETREEAILEALREDLGKSRFEGYMSEVGMVLDELTYMRKNLPRLASRKRVRTPLAQFSARSYKLPSPYGCALVISPWNYPFYLSITPMVDALAAGNTVVVKPSAYSPATSAIVEELVQECFPPEYAAVVTGGRAVNQSLLDQPFDYIFFTGSKAVGRLVMEKASAHLTPITLELGGKSPCIVDRSADLKTAAARIAFGKFLNVGQTCVAPDYLIVHEDIQDEFLPLLAAEIRKQYGQHPLENADYGRIINDKHFQRLLGLMESGIDLRRRAARRLAPHRTDRAHGRYAGQPHHAGGDLRAAAAGADLPRDGRDLPDRGSQPHPAGLLFIHHRQSAGTRADAACFLRRRLHQRHHHPFGHHGNGFRRRGRERHGQLSRQSRLRYVYALQEHGEQG